MLISWALNLIFIKPQKTAGTSVEAALSKLCGKNDVVTPWFPYWETEEAGFSPFNYETIVDTAVESGEHWGFKMVKKAVENIDKDFWESSLKATIVRDPFEATVSAYYFYYWFARNPLYGLRHDWKLYRRRFLRVRFLASVVYSFFLAFLLRFPYLARLVPQRLSVLITSQPLPKDGPTQLRDKFSRLLLLRMDYFNLFLDIPENLDQFDAVMRYETLQEDFRRLCEKLGVACPPLPHFKNTSRMHRYHYSQYYTSEAVERAKEINKQLLERTGYEFLMAGEECGK